jgi:hypothetical protein
MNPRAREAVLKSLRRQGRPVDPLNPVTLRACLHVERPDAPPWHHGLGGRSRELFRAGGFDAPRWRPLSVEVSPAGVRGFWGEKRQLVGELSFPAARHSADRQLALWRRQFPGDATAQQFQPVFGPGGPLGLYVHNGTAAFRRVTLEPLGAAE